MQYTNTSIIHIGWLCEGEESIISVEHRPKRAEMRTKDKKKKKKKKKKKLHIQMQLKLKQVEFVLCNRSP